MLLAPSWTALQYLLNVLEVESLCINMLFNTKKTVCVVFNPTSRHRIVCNAFPEFNLAGCKLRYVNVAKYLGHTIDNKLCDDLDIDREVKSLFI